VGEDIEIPDPGVGETEAPDPGVGMQDLQSMLELVEKYEDYFNSIEFGTDSVEQIEGDSNATQVNDSTREETERAKQQLVNAFNNIHEEIESIIAVSSELLADLTVANSELAEALMGTGFGKLADGLDQLADLLSNTQYETLETLARELSTIQHL
jgi:hypothetical protein